ncbi:hypothetical protein CXB51_027028 [Gossypium anomalum]|uniref:Protein kinase domain-containing protein n=1 Tax=Gossypium anomalum TaxID=47600 RepID=A0A8J5YF36_9ROSI|nr:hypothetical protein CXB51_027028 [Gossypium anomalum]
MDWTRGRTIGRGSTAVVSVATDNYSGDVFAVKSSELYRAESLKREQRILSTLSCPHVVAYKGCDVSSENGKVLYNLFMEYAPKGTVVDAIEKHGGGLDDATVRLYTRGILLGLRFLHGNGIVHCDIKGRNILVTDDDGVKIADLGCAKRVNGVSSSVSGTPLYMAPEVARGEQQGFPADIWALGCTVIEMVTGKAPWPDVDDPLSALYRIGFSSDVPEIPNNISKQAKDFLTKCLKRNPFERWSVIQLLAHEFVNESKFAVNGRDGSQSETPTSVLNRQLWDSMEEIDTNQILSKKPCLPVKCLMKRIQLLVEDDLVFSLKMPNWDCDENWVTVRSNGNLEEEAWVSSNNVDEPHMNDDYGLGLEISGQKTSNNFESRCKTSSFMACKYVTFILCTKLNYRNDRYTFNGILPLVVIGILNSYLFTHKSFKVLSHSKYNFMDPNPHP